jgi:hypothetical protein
VNLDDYVTSIPITEPLTLKDRERVSRDYINRMQLPGYIKAKYDTEEFSNTNAEMQFGIGLIKVGGKHGN